MTRRWALGVIIVSNRRGNLRDIRRTGPVSAPGDSVVSRGRAVVPWDVRGIKDETPAECNGTWLADGRGSPLRHQSTTAFTRDTTAEADYRSQNGHTMTRERTVTVYTREGCHLCREAVTTVERVAGSVAAPVEVELTDVDRDETLRAEYGDRVPYVLIDGRPAFKYRVDEQNLREKLTG